jgi:hypothetical protein
MLHHPSLHQCYGRIANDQGLDPLRLDPSPPASPASDNLVSLLEGALSFAIFTVPLLLSGVLPHAVLQSPHPCGDAYPATTEISVNGLAVVAAPGILGMVLRKAVAIADVRALDAVQRHVHGADAQHRGVEVEAVEQARVETAGSTGGVADYVLRLGLYQLHHHRDDAAGRAELAVLAGRCDLRQHVLVHVASWCRGRPCRACRACRRPWRAAPALEFGSVRPALWRA